MHSNQIQKLIDVNPDPVIIVERSGGRILFANRASGYNSEDTCIYDIITPSEKEKLSSFLNSRKDMADFHFRVNGRLVSRKLYADEFDGDRVIITFKNTDPTLMNFQEKLFDNLDDAVVMTNASLEIIAWNKAAERIYGYPAGEALGKNISGLLHTEMTEAERNKLLFQLSVNDSVKWTSNRRNKNGDPVFAEVSTISLRDDRGGILGYISVSRDITQKLDTLSRLRESSARIENIVSSLPMVLLELDSEGTFIMQQGKALAEAGLEAGQLIGNKFQEMFGSIKVNTDSGEIVNAIETFSRVMNGEVVAGNTYFGGRFYDNYFLPVRKNSEKPSGLLGICLDITDRVNFERSYRNTEQRFRLIAENTSELISMVSEGVYLYISPSYEKVFGYTLNEIHEMGPLSLVHPEDLPRMRNWQRNGMMEFRVRNKAGQYMWVEGESFLIKGEPMITVGIARNINKRKAAEEALKESEERYRLLFERNPLPMFVYDEETLMFLAVNESAINHYGYTRDEFMRMTIMEIRPTVDVPELLKLFKSQRKGMNRFGVWRHILKSGVIINVDVTSHAIVFNNRPARLVLAEDVTAKVKAQNALRESEEKYRMIVENANEGILLINKYQLVTFVNPTLADIVGYQRGELDYQPVLNFVFEEDRLKAELYIKENIEGSRAKFEFRLKHKDGSERWAAINAVPIFDEKGDYAGGLALITDITGQRKAEAEYHRLNELLRSLINYSPLSTIILDKNGNVELWNPASERMFGWTSQEVLGKPLPFVSPDKAKEHLSLRNKIMRGESFTGREVLRTRKDGKKIHVSVAAAPLFDSDHHPIGISSFLSDVSEKKKSEREREKLFKQITTAKNRLKTLSAKLIKVQEIEKRNISRELHDEIGQLLTAIKIDAQRIKQDPGSPQTVSIIDDCTRLVENTISVVRNLSLELRPSMLDDLGLTASLRWYLDKFHQRTGIKVMTELEKLPVKLSSECSTTLFRICQEALTNIAKHSEAGYVKVSLSKNKSSVTLTVEDDGKGFDLQKALKQAASGKSLGLLSMQERIELLGGRFSIKSGQDTGTLIKASCRV